MKKDTILDTYVPKRSTLITELPKVNDATDILSLAELEVLEYFNTRIARSLRDIKIGEELSSLVVDTVIPEGDAETHYIKPSESDDWKDVKDKD